jgi:phosphohistidine phosphatase SixA
MRIVFVRHGERRKGESDPALTSAGRRMARETALWLRDHGVSPAHVVSTPTTRTRETADELSLVFADAARHDRPESPEHRDDWDRLLDVLARAPGLDRTVCLVGHHPTVDLLLREYGPAPVAVPRHHFASALVLDPRAAGRRADGWSIRFAWPGRAA